MSKIIVVAGPTASGKTALAIEIAEKFNGEIVSADSMQIYKYLDIGTAKPTKEEQAKIHHHMIDVAEPGELYSVGKYEKQADLCVQDILARNKMPIVCGGTGLYINALISGHGFSEGGQETKCREELEKRWENGEAEQIFDELLKIDPQSAEKLHLNDKKRILRAMEVYLQTGETITAHNERTKTIPPKYDAVMLGLNWRREILYDRINGRVTKMLDEGLLEETKALLKNGFLKGTAAQAIGYKEMLGFINGECSLEESADLLRQKSRNYAKRQITWFSHDARIKWVDCAQNQDFAQICHEATKIVSECGVK